MAPDSNDVWGIDSLDLDAYLDRVGQPAAPPSLAALTELHEAHVSTIPFENIDPVSGRTPTLTLDAISAKLVHRRRGGYCYEHGLLFAAALERLGYVVSRRTARIPPGPDGSDTHMALVVTIDGRQVLADVGFGMGPLAPMRLEDGHVVDQAGWPHRLVRDGRLWRLEKQLPDGWRPSYAVGDTPQWPTDYEIGNHYVATYPDSVLGNKLVVARLEPGRLRRLVGRTRLVERPDGSKEETLLEYDDVLDALHELDIVLTDDEAATLLETMKATT